MGNPAAPAQSSSSHGRRASVASSLAANAAAAQSVGVLLGPLLARCGLSDSRILRVVSLCPCSGSVPDDGDDIASSSGSGGADNDLRLTGLEHRANLGKGLFGRGRRGRRRQACTGGVEQALLRNGGASAVSLVAENSRLGVADAFRQAVLCGNPALVTALSRSDDAAPVLRRRSGGGSASTGILARPRGATGSRRSTALDIGHSVIEKGGRKGDRGSSNGSRSEGEGEEPFPYLLSMGSDDGDYDNDGSERCTVVGSTCGLLLSSSHLLWTLQPPFGTTDEARLLTAGRGETDCGSSGDDGGGGRDHRSCGDISGSDANSNALRRDGDVEAGPAMGCMSAWDGPGGQAGVESIAARGGSRRQRIALDVAWLDATPVGSRVYYCLEEAEWEAARRQHSVWRRPSRCKAQRRKSRRYPIGSDYPEDNATDEQRERSGGNVSSRFGPDTAKSGVGHNRVEAEGSADRVPRGGWRRENATDADGRKEAAAMVFARSVSGMLAEAYLGGAKARPGEEKVGLCAERTEKDAKEVAAAGPGGGGAWKGHAWGSLADAPPAGAKAVPSLVVSEIADAHRRRPRLNSNNDAGEDRRLSEALDAIPDVLVAEVGAAGPKRAAKWKQAAESSPTGSRPGSVVSSDARESHGRRRQPAQESGNWRGGARAPATPANAPLHFAPAGVLHLLGTTECREFVEALPPATRARVLALHEGFPDETPPVGRLYVPLASPTSRESLSMTWGGATSRGRRRAARGLWEADDNSGKEQVSTHREEGGQTRPMPVAVEIGATEAVSDRPRYASNTASGATPALLGALVHTLPTQAVRELLQVYLVTTRAVGAVSVGGVAAGEGVRVRRRTSGLLMLPPPLPPPPPPHFLARDCATPASRIDGVDNDKKDGNVNGNRRKSNSGPSGWRAVPDGGASVERRPEDLSEKGGGGDGMEGGRGWLCVAAMPPSAVDVLPDAPSSGDRAVDGPPVPPIGRTEGSAVGLPGKEKERQTSFRYDCPDDFIGGADAGNALKIEASVGGRKPQTSAGMTIEGGREMSSRSRTTGDMAIFSSLQAPYHHAYVAVLAPPSPAVDNSTGDGNVTDVGSGNITSNGNGNSNINGHITGNGNSTGNGARVVAASNIIDPISSASALILQVDRSVPESPRCDASENDVYGDGEAPATTSGSGGYDEVVVMGKRGKEGAREVPPRVCGWRACLADAAAG